MEMACQKNIASNPKSTNPTHVASVVHPTSFLAGRNACVSFRVRCKMFPSFQTTSQNRYEMTRAGAVQKAPDTFLRGAYWTPVCLRGVYWTPPYPPTQHGNYTQWHTCFSWFIKSNIVPRYDRHDTAMTRNDTHFWKQMWGNSRKMQTYYYDLLWIPHCLFARQLQCFLFPTRMSPIPHLHTPGNRAARCGYVSNLIDPMLFKDQMHNWFCWDFCKSAEHWSHWSHPQIPSCGSP